MNIKTAATLVLACLVILGGPALAAPPSGAGGEGCKPSPQEHRGARKRARIQKKRKLTRPRRLVSPRKHRSRGCLPPRKLRSLRGRYPKSKSCLRGSRDRSRFLPRHGLGPRPKVPKNGGIEIMPKGRRFSKYRRGVFGTNSGNGRLNGGIEIMPKGGIEIMPNGRRFSRFRRGLHGTGVGNGRLNGGIEITPKRTARNLRASQSR